jgi:hypothetical protein
VRFAVVLLLTLGLPSFGQTPAGSAETKGACSPAVSGSKNTFTIECGIGEKQGHQILKIVNKLLANQQVSLDAVMTKIDELAKAQGQRPTEYTSGNSSPIVPGNGNIITYNNVGPESATAEQKKDIRIALSGFMRAGDTLRDRCSSDSPNSQLEAEADAWFSQVVIWLRNHLDASFDAQFEHTTSSPLGPPSNTPANRAGLWRGVDQRVETLNKFIDEFK